MPLPSTVTAVAHRATPDVGTANAARRGGVSRLSAVRPLLLRGGRRAGPLWLSRAHNRGAGSAVAASAAKNGGTSGSGPANTHASPAASNNRSAAGKQEGDALQELEDILKTLKPEAKSQDGKPTSGSDWMMAVEKQGRALAAEIKRMKVEVAEKARAYAQLQAERAAEREEIISLRRQLEDAREELQILSKEAVKVGQLQDALDRQTKLLEDVGAEMSSFEQGRAADLNRAKERFLELEAALQAAEVEMAQAPEDLKTIETLERKLQESMTAMQKSVDRATQLEKELQATRVEVAEAKAALKAAEKEMAALSKRLEAAVASEEKSVAEARKAQEKTEAECKKLRQSCEDALREKKAVTTTLDVARKEVTGLREDLKTRTKELQAATFELELLQKASKEVEDALVKAEESVKIEEADLLREVEKAPPDEAAPITQRLKRQLEKASVRANSMQSELNSLRSINADLTKEATALQSELSKRKDEVASLKAAVAEAEKVEKALNKELDEQVAATSAVEAEREKLDAALSEATSKYEAAVKAASEVEAARDELAEELAAVREGQGELEADLEKSNKWLSVSLKEVQALKEQDKRSAAEVKELKQSVAAARDKAKEKEAALRKLEDTHAKLQRTYGDQKGQMEALQAQAQDIQKQLLSSEAKMQELSQAETKARAKVEKISIELESSLSSERAAISAMQVAKNKLASLKGEGGSANARVLALETQLKEMKALEDERVEEIAELTAALEEANISATEKAEQMIRLIQQINDVKANEDKRKGELKSAGDKVVELASEIDKLRGLVQQKEEAGKMWEKEARAAQEFARRTAEMGEEAATLASEVSRLESSLKAKENTLEMTMQQRKELETEAAALRGATADLESQVQQLQQREANMQQAMDRVTQAGEQKLETLRMQAAEETQAAMELLQRAEDAAQLLGQQMRSMQSEVATVDGELQRRVEQLERDNARLEDTLKSELAGRADDAERLEVLEQELVARRMEAEESGPLHPELPQQDAEEVARTKERNKALVEKVSKAEAEMQAFKAKAAALEDRNAELEAKLTNATGATDIDMDAVLAGSEDDRLISAFTRVQELQNENRALREAAARRDMVLAQSKHFIDQYLGKKAKGAAPGGQKK
mmetsp:Transcript_13651/g.35057  ORF Transcript_13651/g.35057 Transcript_13651/m.35057 type:complete len:1131 (-) Transcript_13651:57-3449(-)